MQQVTKKAAGMHTKTKVPLLQENSIHHCDRDIHVVIFLDLAVAKERHRIETMCCCPTAHTDDGTSG